MIVHKVKVYPSKIHLPKKNQLAWKIAEIASDNAKLDKNVIEILDGNIKSSLMIGDSETDANAAKAAGIPVILLEDGYTEKNTTEIYHNHLVKDFVGIEKIVLKYL